MSAAARDATAWTVGRNTHFSHVTTPELTVSIGKYVSPLPLVLSIGYLLLVFLFLFQSRRGVVYGTIAILCVGNYRIGKCDLRVSLWQARLRANADTRIRYVLPVGTNYDESEMRR